jgi:hypothetical protein
VISYHGNKLYTIWLLMKSARERVKSGTMKTLLGLEAGISSCVKMADFNPCYIESNMFILFLCIQINI